jgi:hypothetical protein
MDEQYKRAVARLTAVLVQGIISRHFASADDDLIEFAAFFFTPECAADARQIVGATYEYVS